jgi:aryl-alcohol dehydrogenase-like predicted oxidoreductase
MDTRQIGQLDVSVVGLGCNNFGMRIDAERSRAVVDAAIEAGIDYFDTAEAYGGGQSEEFLGAALQGRRDDVYVATKWGMMPAADGSPANGTREAMRTAIDGSLSRLGTDYIDHYQLHNPDPGTPIGETLAALAELVDEGKVREIGCSNFSAEQLDEAEAAAGTARFTTVQNHLSMLTRDSETNGVLDACARHSVGFVPYFPLESGVLTGKYRSMTELPEDSRLKAWGERAGVFLSEERIAAIEAVDSWAADRGRTVLDTAMSWLTSNPQVATVIAGATKAEQAAGNAAAGSWAMTADERAELEALLG